MTLAQQDILLAVTGSAGADVGASSAPLVRTVALTNQRDNVPDRGEDGTMP